jgi:hypothetical protein
MVTLKGFDAVWGVPDESLTCRVKANVPDDVGVPLMLADPLLTVRPGGKLPERTDQL